MTNPRPDSAATCKLGLCAFESLLFCKCSLFCSTLPADYFEPVIPALDPSSRQCCLATCLPQPELMHCRISASRDRDQETKFRACAYASLLRSPPGCHGGTSEVMLT